MAYSAKHFVAKSLDKYGDGTPFYIDAAGVKMLVVLDPSHVKKALLSPDLSGNAFVHNRLMRPLLGSPQEAVDYYQTPGHNMDRLVMLQIRKHLAGTELISMDKKLQEVLEKRVDHAAAATAEQNYVDIPDLYIFFMTQLTLAIGEALLGSAMIESYPRFVEDLWTFMESTDILLLGLPRCFAPAAHGARDRLLEHIKAWGRKSDAMRAKDAVKKTWDPVAGSTLLQEREQMFASLPGHGDDGRAAQTLGLLFASTSFLVPVTFWFLYEVLRDQNLHQRVLKELQQYQGTDPSAIDFAHLATSPFLQSLHSESIRFYTRNAVAREVTAPIFQLDDRYVVEKGTPVLIPSAFAARYTSEWARTRPQAVKRPLTEFWPERFLTPDAKGARYSDVGLSGNWTSFGGGEHKCPGRFFARDIALVTLAIFLGKYEIEVVDPQGARKFDPVWNEIAFGTMVPKGPIAARMRRRKV
ncbi:hypothetical protein E8E13_004254 [Curvularia kusanoi]|uniref:Cytochrome P450 n=1 Tax=Curvularia kusanoi TaxID=90978 RepID=A0A9P4T6L1_CURKU|nr:hypothetical protein E8E13_004254 [Curvularia kusanoi]